MVNWPGLKLGDSDITECSLIAVELDQLRYGSTALLSVMMIWMRADGHLLKKLFCPLTIFSEKFTHRFSHLLFHEINDLEKVIINLIITLSKK